MKGCGIVRIQSHDLQMMGQIFIFKHKVTVCHLRQFRISIIIMEESYKEMLTGLDVVMTILSNKYAS